MKNMVWCKRISGTVGISLIALLGLGMISGCSNDRTVVRTAYPAPYYYPYDYYYYPYSRVYFSISTGYYYYPDGPNWIKVKVLPSRFYLDPRDRVVIRLKTKDRPYIHHHTHLKRYTPSPKIRLDRKRDRIERNLNRERFNRFHKR